MTDPQLRDLGKVVAPDFRRTEPVAPALPERSAVKALEGTVKVGSAFVQMRSGPKLFNADRPDGQDAFGIEPLLSLCAELAVHKNTELPLCFGILGAAGSGKSFALSKLGAAAEALAAQAKDAGRPEPGHGVAASPYMAELDIVRVDAAHLDGEPMTALASALCNALHSPVPELVEEALHSVRDPQAAVSEAAERLDQAQRRLHQERDHLTEIEGRRARLFETLLYETPGSQVDAYIRTQRPRITSRLQAFGFSGDPILNYKDLVASLAPVESPLGNAGIFVRSLWAFKGQARLLLIAFVLVVIGLGIDWAIDRQDIWLSSLRTSRESLESVATWFENHMGTFAALARAAYIGAALAVLLNVWRAFRFLQPILRGARLLKGEFANRRHELDSALAHQTRRVDGLLAEVERAGRAHAEADHLAGKTGQDGHASRRTSLFQPLLEKTRAVQFIESLGTALEGKSKKTGKAPRRVFVLLDNLDALPQARACEVLEAVHHCLNTSVFVTAIAVDPERLIAPGRAADLEKWVQVPVRIEAMEKDQTAFVSHLLGRASEARNASGLAASRSLALAAPIAEEEEQLLIKLAPLAGLTARALKRFVNLYRLARPLLPEHRPLLALMLALKNGGTASEVEAMINALAVARPGTGIDVSQEHLRLKEALVNVASVEPEMTAGVARQAMAIADVFSFQR